MRSIWLRRLNNLLCVKSIVTIVLTVVFARLSLAERISNQDFLTVFSVILESRMRNRRNCQRRRQKNCLPKSDSGIGKRGVLDVWLWEFLSVVHPSEVSRLAGTGRTSRGPRSPWPYWSCGEESQAKLDPPDSKDSQGREVPQVPGESPGPQALWARCLLWKLEGLSPERPPR